MAITTFNQLLQIENNCFCFIVVVVIIGLIKCEYICTISQYWEGAGSTYIACYTLLTGAQGANSGRGNKFRSRPSTHDKICCYSYHRPIDSWNFTNCPWPYLQFIKPRTMALEYRSILPMPHAHYTTHTTPNSSPSHSPSPRKGQSERYAYNSNSNLGRLQNVNKNKIVLPVRAV